MSEHPATLPTIDRHKSEGLNIMPRVSAAAAVSTMILGLAACGGAGSPLEGDWDCLVFGTEYVDITSIDGENGIRMDNESTYKLRVEGNSWSSTGIPADPSYELTLATGTFDLGGDGINFVIDSVEQGGPQQTDIGLEFEMTGVPQGLDSIASISDGTQGGPERFSPTPRGFQLVQSEDTFVDCIRAGSA